jgi:hypothetical protein
MDERDLVFGKLSEYRLGIATAMELFRSKRKKSQIVLRAKRCGLYVFLRISHDFIGTCLLMGCEHGRR